MHIIHLIEKSGKKYWNFNFKKIKLKKRIKFIFFKDIQKKVAWPCIKKLIDKKFLNFLGNDKLNFIRHKKLN